MPLTLPEPIPHQASRRDKYAGQTAIALILMVFFTGGILPFVPEISGFSQARTAAVFATNSMMFIVFAILVSLIALTTAALQKQWAGLGWLSFGAGSIAALVYMAQPGVFPSEFQTIAFLAFAPIIAPFFFATTYFIIDTELPSWFYRYLLGCLLWVPLVFAAPSLIVSAFLSPVPNIISFFIIAPLILKKSKGGHPHAGPFGVLTILFVAGSILGVVGSYIASTNGHVNTTNSVFLLQMGSIMMSTVFLLTLLLHFITEDVDRVDRFLAQEYHAQDAALIFDSDGSLLHANPTAIRIFPHVNTLHKFSRLFPSRHAKRIENVLTDNDIGSTTLANLSLKRPIADIQYVEIEISKRHTDLIYIKIHDATSRQQLSESLLDLSIAESAGVLAATIAHDFNNALSAIQGHLTLIQINNAQPSTEPSLVRLERHVDRATSVSRRLLAFSRFDNTNPEQFNLNDSLQEVLVIAEGAQPECVKTAPI